MTETTAVDRLETGRALFARLLKTLLNRNAFTHADLKAFHDWACPGARTWLSTSQISGLRTQKLKAPGPRAFDALGQINLRLAELAGSTSPDARDLQPLGPLPSSLKRVESTAWFASHPRSRLPLTAGDLFMVWLGRLDPELEDDSYSDRQARAICERLAIHVQGWMLQQGLLPINAREQIESIYPVASQSRRDRLWSMLMAGSPLNGEQLLAERDDLMQLLGALSCGRPITVQEWDRWIATGSLPAG